MIKRDELIRIGQFNKPHGLDGELAFTFTDDVFDRTDAPYIVCEVDGIFVPFFFESYRFRSDSTALVKLLDVDSADDARMFTNLDVYFAKALIPHEDAMLGGKEYFKGYEIIDRTHGSLGIVTEVNDETANVLFVVAHHDDLEGDATLLIPAVDALVEKIDEKKRIIYMNLPEGLVEREEE